jgi:hypothetical protein
MQWRGAAGDALTSLNQIADTEIHELPTEQFWQPGRVLRSIIDSDIKDERRTPLINQATELALKTFATSPTSEDITAMTESLKAVGLYDIGVEQKSDSCTADATLAVNSQRSAERIAEKIPAEQSKLIVPLCHGGFSAGVQTALYLQQQAPESTTRIYPVRYSTQKLMDVEPFITPDETELIREAARDHAIIVFDEDTCTGFSVGNFVEYLDKKLPRSAVILGVVNKDFRPQGEKNDQGEWWEGRRQASSILRTFFDTILRK